MMRRTNSVLVAVVVVVVTLPSSAAGRVLSAAPATGPVLAFTQTPPNPARTPFARFAWTGPPDVPARCSLDGAPASPCASPIALAELRSGPHSFVVSVARAQIAYAWQVVAGPPPRLEPRMFERAAGRPLALIPPTRASGGPWYSIQWLRGGDTRAWGLDEQGDAVGTAHDANYVYRATVWTATDARRYPSLGGDVWNSGSSIASPNLFAGQSEVPTGDPHAVLYRNGTLTDLGTLGGVWSVAQAVNPAGVVVGVSTPGGDGPRWRAFVASGGRMTDLAAAASFPPNGWASNANSWANAINRRGDIAGEANSINDSIHPFLVRAGKRGGRPTVVDLDRTAFDSEALGINDEDEVVGWSLHTASEDAWVSSRGNTHDLPALASDHSASAQDINNAGDVVGYDQLAGESGLEFRAVIWHGGKVVDLNRLAPAGAPPLLGAFAINDRGQIAAMGVSPDPSETWAAFRLTPLTRLAGLTTAQSSGSPGVVQITVQLDRAAPPGGVTAVLSGKLATLPLRVLVPAGAKARSIPLTLPRHRGARPIVIKATLDGTELSATIPRSS